MIISSALQNSIKSNCETQWMKASIDGNVKFAGEEAKDRLYEPKHKKKLVRVLTVVAYIFFVSLAAIMLSLYYVFLWNGNQKENMRHIVPKSSGYMSARCVYPPPGMSSKAIMRFIAFTKKKIRIGNTGIFVELFQTNIIPPSYESYATPHITYI